MRIAFKTFGCKVNQYNTFLLMDNLKRSGFESTHLYSQAEVLVVNACVVTEKAEKECLRFIKSSHRSVKNVIITGCKPDFLSQVLDETCLYFSDTEDVFSYLQSRYKPSSTQVFQSALRNISERTRATVKIQSGCSQYCSYCIVPYRRGRLYSRPTEEIITEITALTQSGYREIVLTGTQIGLYQDEKNRTLVDLLGTIDEQFNTKLNRVRLSSISPSFVSQRLIEWMKNSSIACPHLHLSLQSGSNAILKSMNRLYTKEQYIEFCAQCRQEIPDFCVSTDIIVGFPGETEADFNATMELVRCVQFSKVHVFPFSIRPGTSAEKLPNRIPQELIKKRTRQILALSKSISYTIKRYFIGKELEVMIEGSNEGFTRNYLRVLVRSQGRLLPGSLVRVIPTECNDEYLFV